MPCLVWITLILLKTTLRYQCFFPILSLLNALCVIITPLPQPEAFSARYEAHGHQRNQSVDTSGSWSIKLRECKLRILFHLMFKTRIVHFAFPRSTSKWISLLNPTKPIVKLTLFPVNIYIYCRIYISYWSNKHGLCPLTFSVERKLLDNLFFSRNQEQLKAAEAKLKKSRYVLLIFQYTRTFSHLTSFGDNRPLTIFENFSVLGFQSDCGFS